MKSVGEFAFDKTIVHSQKDFRMRSKMVDRLLYFTINRGMLFAFVQVGRMVAYVTATDEFFWYAPAP